MYWLAIGLGVLSQLILCLLLYWFGRKSRDKEIEIAFTRGVNAGAQMSKQCYKLGELAGRQSAGDNRGIILEGIDMKQYKFGETYFFIN